MTCTLLHHGVEDLYPLNFSPFGLKYQKGEKEREGTRNSVLKVTQWDVVVVTIIITIFIIVGVGDHHIASAVSQTYKSCSMRQRAA